MALEESHLIVVTKMFPYIQNSTYVVVHSFMIMHDFYGCFRNAMCRDKFLHGICIVLSFMVER